MPRVGMMRFSLNEGGMIKDSRNIVVRKCRRHQPLKRSFSGYSDSEGFNRKAVSNLNKEISDYLATKCEKEFGGRERFKRFEQIQIGGQGFPFGVGTEIQLARSGVRGRGRGPGNKRVLCEVRRAKEPKFYHERKAPGAYWFIVASDNFSDARCQQVDATVARFVAAGQRLCLNLEAMICGLRIDFRPGKGFVEIAREFRSIFFMPCVEL
uniref:DUF1336 domain-containing protein n=1 Tax=Ascaris lumbricoides TaxID=6252 RepID=A0A0M3IF26_ASCLU